MDFMKNITVFPTAKFALRPVNGQPFVIEKSFYFPYDFNMILGVQPLPAFGPNGFDFIELSFPKTQDIGFYTNFLGRLTYLVSLEVLQIFHPIFLANTYVTINIFTLSTIYEFISHHEKAPDHEMSPGQIIHCNQSRTIH